MELHPERETEIKAWDDATFLNKAKLTIKGQITNSTIILLGREESEHFLSPAVCKIRWMRKKMGQTKICGGTNFKAKKMKAKKIKGL